MISYKPFQKLLIDKGIRKGYLANRAGISSATMARLNSNKYVSLEVLDKLCAVLGCQPGDLLEYVPEESRGSRVANRESD